MQAMIYPREPIDDEPEAGCKLMDGFAIFIQLCLATAAFSTLIIKRQREHPQRPVRIWAFDVSKQLVGGIVIHSLNVVASYFFGVQPEAGQGSNPCVWYFLNIFVDTTLGVVILWSVLLGFRYFTGKLQWSGFQSGVYGDPPFQEQIKAWSKQLAVYIISLIIMKIIVVAIFHLCPWISDFGRWVLQWTMGNYKLQVVFVMLIFPLVMNIIQFWVVDTIVKHKADHVTTIRLMHDQEDAETLLPRQDLDQEEGDVLLGPLPDHEDERDALLTAHRTTTSFEEPVGKQDFNPTAAGLRRSVDDR
ncbi:vacuolar membrane protein-domain-containing protein [Radiomyces spectabilis]|uniref:vacuolar membrane protein-domain-containing protein n=1 Tax=Radiomyces spectabilis TaxID=64574 RepID=UPI00221F9857|nr:vacuolar membrane protein-domain-containing protein [Radiomyces spectabilis]KAI8377858.1 vacuolar membrane protein-domain-containing protein [Radiomyces spectabilis]